MASTPDSSISSRPAEVYPRLVTKRLIDVDDAALQGARQALDTRTIKDTVNTALRQAAAVAARRRHLERFALDQLPDLRGAEVMDQAWR